METPLYKRIVLKLSGEALKGDAAFGITDQVITQIAEDIRNVVKLGVEVAIVPGGGNFFRGVRSNNLGIDRASADYMGMMATIMNGVAIQGVLEKTGLETRLLSALEVKAVAETFIRRRALRHLEKKRVIIFSAGTGSPFFSTDTAAALRAVEIGADVLLKATMVDGVFSDDPKKVKNATRYTQLTYDEVLTQNLKVIDSTAVQQ